MSYLYTSDFPFKNFFKLAQHAEAIRKKLFGQRVMTHILIGDKSKDHDNLPHFDLFFYHNINVKENGFFRARAEKGIAQHIDSNSVINNGNLAKQISSNCGKI